jgi:hypothetical protein
MNWFKAKKDNKPLTESFKTKPADGIYSVAEFRRIIDRERARADRTDHQFSMIVLDLGPNNGNPNSNGQLLRKVYSRLRRIDELGWYDNRRIGIILPYTSEKGAQAFAESLCQLMDPATAECVFNLFTYGAENTGADALNPKNVKDT